MADQFITDLTTTTTLNPTDLLVVETDPAGTPLTKSIEWEDMQELIRDAAGGAGVNLLPNGGFRVAQRGDGPFTSATTFVNNDDAYLIDGCIFLANGSDTCDVSRVADNAFASGYKIRLDVETANRRFGVLFPIENKDIQEIVRSGKASIQFKIKRTGTSIGNVRAYLLAWNGTADAITSDVINTWGTAGNNPTFATNWTAENVASNIPISTSIATQTIENITVDTSGVTNLALLIITDDTDATVGDFLEIGDVKVENGAECTRFVVGPYQQDLARCLRYLYITPDGSATFGEAGAWNSAASTTRVTVLINFPVELRASPTFSSVGNFRVDDGAAATAVTALTASSATKQRQAIFADVAAGLTQFRPYKLSANNDTTARLVFSAEL